jgi:predicted nucleic acid-binding protein
METSKIIIDTDILIDFLRNKKDAVDFIISLEQKKIVMATTVINSFELHYGAKKSKNPQKSLQTTNKLLERLIILPLTSRSAQKSGHIYATLEAKGQPIRLRDTFIGAIALTKECSVATRNLAHFSKIENLKIMTF